MKNLISKIRTFMIIAFSISVTLVYAQTSGVSDDDWIIEGKDETWALPAKLIVEGAGPNYGVQSSSGRVVVQGGFRITDRSGNSQMTLSAGHSADLDASRLTHRLVRLSISKAIDFLRRSTLIMS